MAAKILLQIDNWAVLKEAVDLLEAAGFEVAECCIEDEPEPADYPLAGKRLAVLEALPYDSWSTSTALAAAHGFAAGTAVGRLSELHHHLGLIEKQPGSRPAQYRRLPDCTTNSG
ncbi:MAG: hypothetical protein IT204_21340 [Fimbriimonadaceae bacterium]|nr:hypothetical protein [Fimbriimonadaceae bacterium]